MTTRKISYYDYLVSFLIVDGYNIQWIYFINHGCEILLLDNVSFTTRNILNNKMIINK